MASKARLASAPKTNKGDNNKGDRHIYFKKICVLTLFSNQFIYLPPNTAPWHFKLCHVFYILNVPVPLFFSSAAVSASSASISFDGTSDIFKKL